jgi:transcriptional regulator with XRE-family HTH domain
VRFVTYAERLQVAMDAAGVSSSELARALGVSYQAIAKTLRGSTKSLTAQNNAAAAERLGVSTDWLATGHGRRRERPLSPLALDLARAFDELPADRRGAMHAHLMYTIELATGPQTQTGASAAPPIAPPPKES